jgi:hypothetical protein
VALTRLFFEKLEGKKGKAESGKLREKNHAGQLLDEADVASSRLLTPSYA